MTKLRNLFIAITLAFGVAIAAPVAFAGDPQIDAAIEAGTVGERIDGYLGVVSSTDGATERKVQEINNKRRALYEKKAKETGTTINQVAALTAEKQINKLQPGQYYMAANGSWTQK